MRNAKGGQGIRLTGMYEASADPYLYPGTSVLKNKAGIRDGAELDRFEFIATQQRGSEPARKKDQPKKHAPVHDSKLRWKS